MSTIDISMTQTMVKYLEKKEFQLAYEVALLGVADSDYLYLGNEALLAGKFDIAKKVTANRTGVTCSHLLTSLPPSATRESRNLTS